VPPVVDADSATVSLEEPEPGTLAGTNVAVAPAGKPVADSDVVPVKPFSAVIEAVVLPLPPGWMLNDELESDSEKSGSVTGSGVTEAPRNATSWPMLLLSDCRSVAILSPVAPAAPWRKSLPCASTTGRAARSKRSLVPVGAVMPFLVFDPKKPTTRPFGDDVETDGAMILAESGVYRPLDASIGRELSIPAYARMPPAEERSIGQLQVYDVGSELVTTR
jgi:hypothetical protein